MNTDKRKKLAAGLLAAVCLQFGGGAGTALQLCHAQEVTAAEASETEEIGAILVRDALERVGKGFDMSVRFGPDYYDCSGFVFSCLQGIGINDSRLPITSFAWKRLADEMDVGSEVSFGTGTEKIRFRLEARDVSILEEPELFKEPGTVIVFVEPGEEFGHTAISLGLFDRVDGDFDSDTEAHRIVTETEQSVIEKLTALYRMDPELLNGKNLYSRSDNVWMHSYYLGTDMNLGECYSGPYNPVWKIDASGSAFGVSVNNSPNGKNGRNVTAVFVPVAFNEGRGDGN